jgi:hypothetical protein
MGKVDPWKNHRRFVGILVLTGGLFTGTVYSFFYPPEGYINNTKKMVTFTV